MTPDTTHDDHPAHAHLRGALHRTADGLQVRIPGADAAITTARHRARRKQRVTAGLTALVLAAGGFGAYRLLDHQPTVELAVRATAGSGTTFVWTDGEGALSHRPRIVQGPDGVLYALSTAPGVTYEDAPDGPLPQAVYRSEDGLSWAPTALNGLQLATFDITADGLLYGLSTAPATGGGVAVHLTSSADGGRTWHTDALPLEDDRPVVAEGVTLAPGGSRIDVVVHGEIAVAVIEQQWFVQPEGLVEEAEDGDTWLTPTDEGLVVRQVANGPGDPAEARTAVEPDDPSRLEVAEAIADPAAESVPAWSDDEPTVVRTIPWSEVGLTGPADLISSQALTAADDGPWSAVDLGVHGAQAHVVGTGEGFVAILTDPATESGSGDVALRVTRSADGITWTPDPDPIGSVGWLQDVGTVGDDLVVVAQSWETSPDGAMSRPTSQALSSGDAGRTWTTIALDGLMAAPDDHDVGTGSADVGALGVAVPVTAHDPARGEVSAAAVLYSPDGLAWDVIPVTDLHPDARRIAWLSIDADRVITSVVLSDNTTRTVVGIPQG